MSSIDPRPRCLRCDTIGHDTGNCPMMHPSNGMFIGMPITWDDTLDMAVFQWWRRFSDPSHNPFR